MKATQKVKYNGDLRTAYITFEEGTNAVMVTKSQQNLKFKKEVLVSITGNYDKTKVCVSMGSLGEVVVTPISNKVAEVGQKVNHSIHGEVEILSNTNGIVQIKLEDGTIKPVMQKFFMNGVK